MKMLRYLSDYIMRHSGTRRQGELPELAEISSSDVVFTPAHQPQLDPDTNRDSDAP